MNPSTRPHASLSAKLSLPISVVIPVFNKEGEVERCIRSVLAQSARPAEIVVVNDQSTDRSEQVVVRIQSDSAIPIKLVSNERNLGAGGSRNVGVRAAAGDWVAFLDADDFWHPKFCELLWHRVNIDDAQFASSGRVVRNSRHWPVQEKIQILSESEARDINYSFWKVAMRELPINSSSILVSRKLLDSAGGFPEDVRSYEDVTLWARLWLQGKFTVENIPLSTYDRVPKGITSHRKRDRDVGLFAFRFFMVVTSAIASRRPGSFWAAVFLLRFLAVWPLSSLRTLLLRSTIKGAH